LEDAFYVNGFVPPSIASIVPNNAIAGATLDVTINGSNTHFSEGNNTFLDFGFNQGSGTIINSLSIPDNITLIANITVPPDAIDGSYDVYLSNSIDGFLYAPGGFNLGLVGMNMINPEISFTVYPNPTAGDLTLENHSKQIAHDAYFSVYNQKGQLVLKQQLKDERTNINLDSHSSGYYFIVLNNSPGTLIYKILKE
jgi:hypothetical protein